MSRTLPSVCPLDCPDRCSLSVEVDGGQVLSIRGTAKNPLTDGFICSKVAKFARRVHGPERVLHPAVRVGPKGPGARFERVSWEEAMNLAASRLAEVRDTHGGEAILPYWYGGSNGYLTGGGLDARLWARLGTSQLLRTFCAVNAGAAVQAVYGDLPSAEPIDVDQAEAAILWGVNPSATSIHLVPRINALLERGGRLVVVDPRRIPLARKATLHLQPLPGTDVVVALAMLHLAFARGHADEAFLADHAVDADAFRRYVSAWTPERAASIAGVPAKDIEAAAEIYASASPAFVRCGWGVERTRNGADAIRAVLSLPAVYGKFGVRGGGYCMSTTPGYRTDKSRFMPAHPPTRAVNMSRLGRALEELTPPIRALWVYDCNPVATAPDQQRVIRGLSREDLFTVVHEQSWTDTTDYADVVLPATTFLEHKELTRSYGGYVFQWADPVIAPVGEARSNHAVFGELARRLGYTGPDVEITEEALAQAIVEATPTAPADAWARVKGDLVVEVPSPVQFGAEGSATRIHLYGDDPPRFRPPPCDAERPLALISPASGRGITSTLFETLGEGEATVAVHPEDAASRGLSKGDVVRVWNDQGEARLLCAIDADLRPGVCAIPKGVWRKSTLNGFTSNALVPDHVDSRGGGACYNDARVDLERVP